MFLKTIRLRVFATALLVAGQWLSPAYGQSKPASKQHSSPSLTERVLKFLGISASPSTLKGPGDEVVSGQVWIADRGSGTTRQATTDDGYRSPVFIPGQNAVLALRANNVVKIALEEKRSTVLFSMPEITKLVGFGLEESDKVLVVMRDATGQHPRAGTLSLTSGSLQTIPYDPRSPQDLQMLESLQSWSRTYGNERVYVRQQTKDGMSGTIEWTDVFLSSQTGEAVDLSNCDGQNCGQPSLSQDAHLLVFVKSRPK